MGFLGSETQILHCQNDCCKWALRITQRACKPGCPHSVRTLCPNFKNHEDKPKRQVLTFVSMSLICPGMFTWQSVAKVLLHPNKHIALIIELYKLHKIGSSLGSITQTLHVLE